MSHNLTTNTYKFESLKKTLADVITGKDIYYLFISDFVTPANSSLQTPSDINSLTLQAPYAQMISGKMALAKNFNYVIRYIPYDTVVFSMYDDQDTNLPNADFYCVTTEGSYYHIWKCLDNNNGANSSAQPMFSDVSGTTPTIYQTADGYRWKYMASADNQTVYTFKAQNTYFPLIANTSVTSNTVPGCIDIVKIEAQGKYYNNFLDGTFTTSDLYVSGTKTWFNLSNNSVATTNSYYTGCLLYLSSGPGSGQYRTITDYSSNNTGNIIKLDTAFGSNTSPVNGTTYQIRPKVEIQGDTLQTINCVARALINTYNSNSVFRVEVLERGAGYVTPTAVVNVHSIVRAGMSNAAISLATASIRPILAPTGGHGADPYNELYCHNLEVAVKLDGTENTTIPAAGQYSQFGLIKNPLFANVVLTWNRNLGVFNVGETASQILPTFISSNVTVTKDSSSLVCTNAYFTAQLSSNASLYITNPDRSLNQIVTINTIVSNTVINLASNSTFSCTQAIIYTANVISNSVVTGISANTITVTNATPFLGGGSLVIGQDSGAVGIVGKVTRNAVDKEYTTFVQMYKYIATVVNGTFQPGEVLKQGNNTCYLHSYTGSSTITLYAADFSNGPFVADIFSGANSNAQGTITTIYPPELVYGSGVVQYLENINPITRQSGQYELFQIILNA